MGEKLQRGSARLSFRWEHQCLQSQYAALADSEFEVEVELRLAQAPTSLIGRIAESSANRAAVPSKVLT